MNNINVEDQLVDNDNIEDEDKASETVKVNLPNVEEVLLVSKQHSSFQSQT